MIEQIEFGRTGHRSSRIIFGAAALGGMRQEKADGVIDLVRRAGINHFDTAASYGDSELRLAPFLEDHRSDVFLATKTGERTGSEARRELEFSLQRLGTEQVDLIQMHNLTDEQGWRTAMGTGGALEALIRARDEGLVRFIGVTGHGTYAAAMHLRSLDAFEFDSVLVPYNYSMRQDSRFRRDLDQLIEACAARRVACQTIKAIARRRWNEEDPEKRFSWYMPIRAEAPLKRAIDYVLSRPGTFLNTTSDATLLPAVLAAAAAPIIQPSAAEMARDQDALGVEPLFVRDVSDDVRPVAGRR
ncbi:MAG: aldo/keto reductase [Pseudomonadales bacterium]|nr:aldo/keto reductase [Pseudomonadales bacterium]